MVFGQMAIPFGMLWNAYDALNALALFGGGGSPLTAIATSIRINLPSSRGGIIRADYSSHFSRLPRRSPLRDKTRQMNGMKATNPRDFVYALLGVASDIGDLQIEAEPDQMCSDVWINLTEALIKQSGNLKVLAWCQAYRQDQKAAVSSNRSLCQKTDKRPKCNRQVPDISSSFMSMLSHFGESGAHFQASKCIPGRGGPLSFDINKSTRVLTISGLSFDTVHQIPPLTPAPPPPTSQPLGYQNLESHCCNAFPARFHLHQIQTLLESKTSGEGNHVDALYRTPICDLALRLDNVSGTISQGRAKDSLFQSFRAFDFSSSVPDTEPNPGDWRRQTTDPYARAMLVSFQGRNSFITERGHVGLGPKRVQNGDLVCAFIGANVPFVLRHVQWGRFELVGECYVYGIMDGEFLPEGREIELFELV
jgi:hypothetical protein